MSEYSSFIILRYDKKNTKIISKKKVESAYKYSNINLTDDKDMFNKKVKIEDIPKYIPNSKLTYINHFKREQLDKILDIEFNSMFTVLRDEFNLSPYTINNRIEISYFEASKMLQALNYLLLEKYDRYFEENILNNDYIKIFGETFTPYYNYYILLNMPKVVTADDMNNYELLAYNNDYKSERIMLTRVRDILNTFILLSDEDNWNGLEYILLYEVG